MCNNSIYYCLITPNMSAQVTAGPNPEGLSRYDTGLWLWAWLLSADPPNVIGRQSRGPRGAGCGGRLIRRIAGITPTRGQIFGMFWKINGEPMPALPYSITSLT